MEFLRLWLKLLKYTAFMSIVGELVILLVPSHLTYIKAALGIAIAMMIIGKRLHYTVKEMVEMLDRMSAGNSDKNT